MPQRFKPIVGLLLGFVLARAGRLSGRRVGLAVVYHRLDRERRSSDRELVPCTTTRAFRRQVRYLRAHYKVVAASELALSITQRRRGQPFPVAVTFDDDLPSHVRLAMPILQQLGVPATFFLCGASLDGPFSFWWERLQRAADEGVDVPLDVAGIAPGTSRFGAPSIHAVATMIEGMEPADRNWVSAALRMRLGADHPDAGLRAGDVRALGDAGFEIGFHTHDHHPLTTLDDVALASAMTAGRAHLAAAAGRPIDVIAYPHGKADRRVAAAARAAGYSFGFTNVARIADTRTDPCLIGRAEPAVESLGLFAWRVARLLAG